MKNIYNVFKVDEDTCLQSKLLSRSIENAQKAIEGRNFGTRKHILEYDDVMNKQREVIYAERMKVIKGEDIHDEILKLIPDLVTKVIRESVNVDVMPEKWNAAALNKAMEDRLVPQGSDFISHEKLENWDYDYAVQKILEFTVAEYEKKIERYKQEMNIDYHEIERVVMLKNVDRNWIDHIDEMDQLRKGIGLRAYGNVDPVISYKQEGFAMFDEMVERIQNGTVSVLLKAEVRQVPVKAEEKQQNLVTNQTSSDGTQKPIVKNQGATAKKNVGRNDPCPCGSGKKYKNCCGKD